MLSPGIHVFPIHTPTITSGPGRLPSSKCVQVVNGENCAQTSSGDEFITIPAKSGDNSDTRGQSVRYQTTNRSPIKVNVRRPGPPVLLSNITPLQLMRGVEVEHTSDRTSYAPPHPSHTLRLPYQDPTLDQDPSANPTTADSVVHIRPDRTPSHTLTHILSSLRSLSCYSRSPRSQHPPLLGGGADTGNVRVPVDLAGTVPHRSRGRLRRKRWARCVHVSRVVFSIGPSAARP